MDERMSNEEMRDFLKYDAIGTCPDQWGRFYMACLARLDALEAAQNPAPSPEPPELPPNSDTFRRVDYHHDRTLFDAAAAEWLRRGSFERAEECALYATKGGQ